MSGVEIRVRSNSTQARTDLSRLERSVANLDRKAQQVTRGFQKAAVAIAAAFTGSVVTKSFANASDQLTNLENQLALVTGRGQALTATMKELYGVSARARLPVSTAATTFNRFGLALQESGKGTQEIIQATEAVLQAATLSGATADTAKASIIQLGQGLASGTLRGEELNSVLEGIPRLARAIADGMGIPFSELRKKAQDGQLTAEAVFDAIIAESIDLNDEFQTLESTVGGLTSVLRDEFTRALAALDTELGFSKRLRETIIAGTQGLRFFADNISFWATVYRARLNLVLNDFIFFKLSILRLFRERFNIDLSGIMSDIIELGNTVKNFVTDGTQTIALRVTALNIDDLAPSLEAVKLTIGRFTSFIANLFRDLWMAVSGNSYWWDIFSDRPTGIAGPQLTKALSRVSEVLKEFVSDVAGFFSDLYGKVSAKWKQLFTELTTTEFTTPFGGTYREQNEFGRSIDSSIEKVKELRDTLAGYFSDLQTTTVLNPRTNQLEEQFSPFGKLIDAISGISGEGIVVSLSTNFESIINKLYEVWQAGGRLLATSVGGVGVALAGAGTSIAGSIASGEAIASEFISKVIVDAEKIGGAISLALLAKAALGLSFKTITLAGGAIIFAADVLNNPATQASLTSLGRGIGSFLATFFDKDGGADKVGRSLANGIRRAFESFGGGILDGFKIKLDSATADRIVGGVAATLALAAVSPLARKALLPVGVSLIGGLFGKGAISAGLKLFKWGFIASLIGPLIEDGLKELFNSDNPLVNALLDTIDEGVLGAGLGATLGGMFGPFGVVGGAIIGGLIGSLAAAFSGDNFGGSAIVDFGVRLTTTLKDIFQSIASWMVDPIVDAFTGLWDSIGDGMPDWAKNLFGIDPLDLKVDLSLADTSNLTPEQQQAAGLTPAPFATGGYISGPGGPKEDLIPAMLSNGEFVMQAKAVNKFGPAFMAALNAGKLPQMFNTGGPVGQIAEIDGLIAKAQDDIMMLELDREFEAASRTRGTLADLFRQRERLGASIAADEGTASAVDAAMTVAGGGVISTTTDEENSAQTLAENYAANFKQDFNAFLYQFLIDGDTDNFLEGILDTFTAQVISSFTTGITDGLFSAFSLDDAFEGLFKGIFNWGKDVADNSADQIKEGVTAVKGTDTFKNIFKVAKDLFSSVFDSISGFFSGGGFNGNTGSGLLSGIGTILGFNTGGIVAPVGTSRTDIDSVPAMLTPGELVVPANKVDDFLNGAASGGNSSVFNINVSGDISRQTRKEIVGMLPQIASGVNKQNRENQIR